MEMTDCDKCKYRRGCVLAWDYGSLYCNDYEEDENENLFESD